jgi:hypothetical protein
MPFVNDHEYRFSRILVRQHGAPYSSSTFGGSDAAVVQIVNLAAQPEGSPGKKLINPAHPFGRHTFASSQVVVCNHFAAILPLAYGAPASEWTAICLPFAKEPILSMLGVVCAVGMTNHFRRLLRDSTFQVEVDDSFGGALAVSCAAVFSPRVLFRSLRPVEGMASEIASAAGVVIQEPLGFLS